MKVVESHNHRTMQWDHSLACMLCLRTKVYLGECVMTKNKLLAKFRKIDNSFYNLEIYKHVGDKNS